MNICFVQGKIIEKIDFKFYINSNKVSISKTKIETKKSYINIIGYDEMADWMLQNIKENDNVYIEGKLNNKMEIEIQKICII